MTIVTIVVQNPVPYSMTSPFSWLKSSNPPALLTRVTRHHKQISLLLLYHASLTFLTQVLLASVHQIKLTSLNSSQFPPDKFMKLTALLYLLLLLVTYTSDVERDGGSH